MSTTWFDCLVLMDMLVVYHVMAIGSEQCNTYDISEEENRKTFKNQLGLNTRYV